MSKEETALCSNMLVSETIPKLTTFSVDFDLLFPSPGLLIFFKVKALLIVGQDCMFSYPEDLTDAAFVSI